MREYNITTNLKDYIIQIYQLNKRFKPLRESGGSGIEWNGQN